MKRLFILLVLLIIAWAGLSAGSGFIDHRRISPLASTPSVVEQERVQVGIPQTIRIPKINLVANIEQVGLDAQGRMDVPKDSDNTGWYKLGYKPGEKGNAVLDGHLDKETGEPAVFWDITKLEPGDKIFVTDSQGKEYIFTYIKMNKYPYNDFPIREVFGESSKPMLNLITCQGDWDSVNRNYSHRIVITAEIEP
jgi:sortase (surface protein transpeptidase)